MLRVVCGGDATRPARRPHLRRSENAGNVGESRRTLARHFPASTASGTGQVLRSQHRGRHHNTIGDSSRCRPCGILDIEYCALRRARAHHRVPTGWQDYFPALYGGANSVHLGCEGVKRERLALPAAEIERRFVLCYTGQPRNSGINNWEVMKAHIDGDRRVIKNFARITEIATQMREALLKRNWDSVADLLSEEWENRRRSFKGMSTPRIDKMIRETRRHGTLAAKVCGAGGGGCVVFMVRPGSKSNVEIELTRMGGKVIDLRVSTTGLEVATDRLRAMRSRR